MLLLCMDKNQSLLAANSCNNLGTDAMLYRISGLILAATLLFGCGEVEISTPAEVNARFMKLDNVGNALPVQDVTWDARWYDNGSPYAHWDCVWDRQQDLVWEVKTSPVDIAITNADNTYSWYEYYANPDYIGEQEDPEIHTGDDFQKRHNPQYAPQNTGTENKGDCYGTLCDTKSYRAQKNTATNCGASERSNGAWRLPTLAELKTLNVCTTDTETCQLNTTVYTSIDHFPNTRKGFYWSNEMSIALDKTTAVIDFSTGETYNANKGSGHYIRLVFDVPVAGPLAP